MAHLEQSETKSTDTGNSKEVLGGAELVSPVTDITLSVPMDTVDYGTTTKPGSWYSSSVSGSYKLPVTTRGVFRYRITLEEAEQIFHALRDSIAQAKIVKTLIEDNVI